jgi:putative component of membrane protein insertase Oxa1/YidC/SpoIIIJ protein YidD
MDEDCGRFVRHAQSSFLSLFFFFLVSLPLACSTTTGKTEGRQRGRAAGVFQFYRDVISPVDGDRCQMQPSCSAYTEEALSRHGWLMGWIMGCDRLIRCGGDEAGFSEIILKNDERVCVDSVSGNDFWWNSHE